jgi:3-oxoadipate enol-lactonase
MSRSETGLAYKISGKKGPVLVLLHAYPFDGAMWNEQRKSLRRKARVLAPDLPGFGGSRRVRARSIADMARAVARLLDRLSIKEPVAVAGLSMGGYVALEFARLFPGRVKALGFFATRAGADSDEQRKKRREQAQTARKKGTGVLKRAMVPKMLGKTTLKAKPGTVRNLKRLMSAAGTAGVVQALGAMAARRDNSSFLKRLKVPALVVAGKEDAVIPLADMQRMHRALRGSQFRILPRAGHLLNLEQPAALDRLLSGFLERL